MTSHKFDIGDRVRLVKLQSTNSLENFLNMVTTIDVTEPQALWQVTRLLPPDGRSFQYHVKGSNQGPERLVREEQLTRA